MSTAPEANTQTLQRHARGLLLASLLLLLLWVGVLAYVQARSEWRQLIEHAGHQFSLQRQAFELLARDTARHVDDLGRSFLDADANADTTAPAWLMAPAKAPRPGGGHTLDGIPASQRAHSAQLLAAPELPPAATLLNPLHALAKTAEAAHERHPELVWSYVFTWPAQNVVLYPWSPSSELLDEQGQPNLVKGLQAWYAYEVARKSFVEGLPRYWTEPYLDAAGRGLMVSHAKRLVQDGQLRGLAAADITLSQLAAPLAILAEAPWQAWVVDERGTLLADRQQALRDDRVMPASERLPLSVQQLQAVANAGAGPSGRNGWQVWVSPVAGTPWLLVLAAPDAALQRAVIGALAPYGLIAAGVVALWLWAHWLLDRRLLRPLLNVLGHFQALASNPMAAGVTLPAGNASWSPWVANINRLFSEWRQAQHSQRQAETLKAAVIDHSQIAMIVVDAAECIVEFNPAASALLGHAREDALGRDWPTLISPARFRAINLADMRNLRQGDPSRISGRAFSRRVLHASGEEIPVELVPWTVTTDSGPLLTFSIRDLREQRAAERVIAQQREALRQSEKLSTMGSLLATVAHELNNPLTITLGRAALLEEACEGTPQADDARRIRQAAERCGRIVKTFLHMARSRPANRQALRLNELASAAGDLLAYTLRSHDIELHWALDPNLPTLMADADQLGQVLLNLLVNAQQALSHSERRPRRIVVSTTTEGAWVTLQVHDNGPGVPAAVRDTVFDPFFTTKPEGQGSGLGLSVSRGIAREHGGELRLLPATEGACFELRLPT